MHTYTSRRSVWPTYVHTYIPAYMHVCIHAYIYTCIHGFRHVHAHTHTHACMHVACICTVGRVLRRIVVLVVVERAALERARRPLTPTHQWWSELHVTCYVLHAACYMLHALRFQNTRLQTSLVRTALTEKNNAYVCNIYMHVAYLHTYMHT